MGQLFPHQTIGKEFLTTHQKVLLLDDKGLGKTIICVCSHAQIGGKAIVFCENNKIFDFLTAYKIWAPEISRYECSDVHRSNREKVYQAFKFGRDPSVLIVSHYKVIYDLNLLLDVVNSPIKIGIVDEAAVFNNDQTKLHSGLKWLLRKIEMNWLVTAQPFGINLLQFYHLFQLIDLNLFGSSYDFIEKFCILKLVKFKFRGRFVQKRVIVGAKNLDIFKQIVTPYCLRRTRKSAGIVLPPVRFNALSCSWTDKIHFLYRRALKNQLEMMTRREKFEPLCRHAFISQILDSPFLLDETDSKESPKLDVAIQQIKQINDKVVLFSQFKKWQGEICNRLAKENIQFMVYNGDLTAREKADTVERFRVFEGPVVFVCTAAAERGINLQFCHNLIVLDFLYNPASLLQLFGRLDRIGQTCDVSIYYTVMRGTYEEKIFERLYERQSLIDETFGDEKAIAFDLTQLFSELLNGSVSG